MKQTKYEVQTVKKDNYNNTFDYILVDKLLELFRALHIHIRSTHKRYKNAIKCFTRFPKHYGLF